MLDMVKSRRRKMEILNTDKLTIYIPEGVTRIGDGAFRHQINIRKIILPKTLKSIGKYAFSDCYDLVEVIFNEGIEQIGEGAFYGCDGIEEVSIPGTIKKIDNYAFYRCGSLRNVTIEKKEEDNVMEYIGAKAFMECEGLNWVWIFKNVNKIGEATFKNCTKVWMIWMQYITCGIIPERCFEGCSNLSSVMFKGVHSIDRRAFAYCTKLEDIYLPKKLKYIDEKAFFHSNKLTKLRIV